MAEKEPIEKENKFSLFTVLIDKSSTSLPGK